MSWYKISTENLKFESNSEISELSTQLISRSISQLWYGEYLLIIIVMLAFAVLLIWGIRSIQLKEINTWKISIIPIAVLLSYSIFFAVLVWNIPIVDIPKEIRRGEFGDSFGAINALFSGLAFAGVIITILIQRNDLAEAKKQSIRQQVDSQFYNLLNIQQQIIQGFDLHIRRGTAYAKTVQGRDCFKEWRKKLCHCYSGHVPGQNKSTQASVAAYNDVLNSHLGDLGLYFRSLYSIFRFIEGLDVAEQKKYAVIVRSLLSDYELLFLFYNCLSSKGERFMRFAKAYALFDNLNVRLLMDLDDVNGMTSDAYGDNAEALAILLHVNV